jgi:hypothetical protein
MDTVMVAGVLKNVLVESGRRDRERFHVLEP